MSMSVVTLSSLPMAHVHQLRTLQPYLPQEHNRLVSARKSITCPAAVLARLERVDKNRPAIPARLERDGRDIEIIRQNAVCLNREAQDTLEYQSLIRPK
jgi:hypothetical protein